MLLVGALCAVCGVSAAIAFAAPSSAPRRRDVTAKRGCHRTKRPRCQRTGAKKTSRRRHRAHKHSKPFIPVAGGPGQEGVPGGSVPATSTPGATPSGGSSGAGVAEKSAPALPTPPPAPAHVEVTAEDKEGFRFVLSRSSVPAGKTILEFVNHGQDEHNLNAAEGSEGEVVGSLPNTSANDHLSLTVNLKPGSYTLFCSLPGHAAKGMKATLTVE
ncbi:MAG: plastocyanin/azurin family copper-binding protein [Solirubrobacteraceae bacterium]